MGLISRLKVISVILLTFSIGNFSLIYHSINKMTNDGRVVNHAGIVRGGTQRLIKLETSGMPQDELIINLDKIVNGLINGDTDLGLPKAGDREFIQAMEKVKAAWLNLKRLIQEARQDSRQRNRLIQASEDYWKLTNSAVFAAEDFAKENVNQTKIVSIFLFTFNLILLSAIWLIAKNITFRLQKAISTIAGSSTEIATTVREQEQMVTQQASSVRQTTITMDELNASAQQVAQQAESVAAHSRQVLTLAEGGTQAVGNTLASMTVLKEKVEAIATQIERLSEHTIEISSISELASELANQTNMLALNASVEAVRAGEQGKGFAVIAREIRRLADESKKSAEKINALVTDIQTSIHSTVKVTEEGTTTVESSFQVTADTSSAFDGVASAIDDIVWSSQQISQVIHQQVAAIGQVVEVMSSLNNTAKETADGIGQTKLGVQYLNEAAKKLEQMV